MKQSEAKPRPERSEGSRVYGARSFASLRMTLRCQIATPPSGARDDGLKL